MRARQVNRLRLLMFSAFQLMQNGCAIAANDSESISVIDATGKVGSTVILAVQREVVSLSENPLQHAMQRHVKERTVFSFGVEHRESKFPPKLTKLDTYDSTLWLDREVTSGTPNYGILKYPKATLVNLSESYRRLNTAKCEKRNKFFVSAGVLIHNCDNELSLYESTSLKLALNIKADAIAVARAANGSDDSKAYFDEQSQYDISQVEVDESSVYIVNAEVRKKEGDPLEQSVRVRILSKVNQSAKTHDVKINHGESFVDFKPGGWVVLGINGEGYPNKFKIEKVKITNIYNDQIFYTPPFPSGNYVFLSDTKEVLFFTINKSMGLLEVSSFQFENNLKIRYEFGINDLIRANRNDSLLARNITIEPLN